MMIGRAATRWLACAVLWSTGLPATAAVAQGTPAPTLDEARALYAAGEVAAAVEAFREISVAAESPADRASAHNNACVLSMQLGEHRTALADCLAALRLRRELGDSRAIGRTLNNLGLALQNAGDYAASLERLGEALEINRERGDVEAQAINLDNLGGTSTLAGRYEAARSYHRQAAALATAHADTPWGTRMSRRARLNEAVVLEHLGAYREALGLYRGLHAAAAELPPRDLAALEVNMGVVYRNLGDPLAALRYFRSAQSSYRRLGDSSGLAHAALDVALALHLDLQRWPEAESEYRHALSLAREAGDRPREIEGLFYFGRLLLDRQRLDEAEEVFGKALEIAVSSGSAAGRWSAREGLGRLAELRGDHAEALEHLQAALEVIETTRADLSGGGVRSGFFGARRPAYAATVRVMAKLHRDQPSAGWDARALEVVQRAKSRELLESLERPGGSAARPLTADELLQQVADATVVEYFVGEGQLYRWLVSGGSIELAELGDPAPALEAAEQLRGRLAAGGPPAAGRLAELSRRLLAGIPPPSGGRWRIATDGLLAYLPFELLSLSGDSRPLLRTGTVTYLPSGSAVGWAGSAPAAAPAWTWVGFGNPELSTSSDWLAELRLPPLPDAEVELAMIGREIPGRGRVETGARATEAALIDALRAGTEILHLATHTAIDERPGHGAAIVLAADGEGDGLLRPSEVIELPGAPRLTVLAACSTARGRGDGSRALSSLTGAFLATGSGAVLATLWDVDDAATRVFMEQLYHRLGRGASPAEALRSTKLRLAGDPQWSDPAVWAAYVLIGEVPPLVEPSAGRLRRYAPPAAWALAALLGLGAAVAARRSATRTRSSR